MFGIQYGPVILLLFSKDSHKIISLSSMDDTKKVLSFLFFRNSENSWKNEKLKNNHLNFWIRWDWIDLTIII